MSMIAAPVATWLVGAGASAGVAAVAGAVVQGVVVGAVVGAATAAVTGGDILKGALTGAAIGGISGGIMKGASFAAGASTPESTLGGWGVEGYESGAKSASQAIAPGKEQVATNQSVSNPVTEEQLSVQSGQNLTTNTPPVTPKTDGGWFANLGDEQAKVYAGIGEGAMKGLGQVGASMMEADSAKDLREWEEKQLQARIDNNIPGKFEAQTANIKLPDWWNKHLNAGVATPVNNGLLAQGAA